MASQMVLTCVGCGEDKGTTKTQYEKLLAMGKVEGYLCRSCRPKKTKEIVETNGIVESDTAETMVDDIVVVEEINHKLKLPEWMKNYNPSCNHPLMAKEEFKTINTCFRPDIFYGNKRNNNDDGSCDGCLMFSYCGCLTKVLKKKS